MKEYLLMVLSVDLLGEAGRPEQALLQGHNLCEAAATCSTGSYKVEELHSDSL